MNTTLFLIRHGEIVYPTDDLGRRLAYGPDVPLSESGREQIQRFGERMMQGLRYVAEQEPGRRVGIVSHGDPIRVAVFRLLNPDALLPSIGVLTQTDYLDKGEAWRIVVEPPLHVVEHEYIGRPPEQWGRGERKS